MDEPVGDELVRRVRAGDEDAARQFFRQLQPFVLKIVRNHRSVRHTEEDLCQMIFLKAFTKLHQYSGRMPVSHWISRIAVNTCLNELKKDRARKELREADLDEDAGTLLSRLADPASGGEEASRSARELVQKLLIRLTPADRLVVSLLYLDGHSVSETSALTGFSQATVKIRAFRARQKLNHILQTLLGDQTP